VSRPDRLDDAAVEQWVSSHPGWRAEDNHLIGTFAIHYDQSVQVLVATNADVDRMDHHPRVTVEYGQLTVELWTHDRGGVTELDLSLAQIFSDAVANAT
jgi:4a-hydroxytetrahydrobiopterin dehydratase